MTTDDLGNLGHHKDNANRSHCSCLAVLLLVLLLYARYATCSTIARKSAVPYVPEQLVYELAGDGGLAQEEYLLYWYVQVQIRRLSGLYQARKARKSRGVEMGDIGGQGVLLWLLKVERYEGCVAC